MTTNHDLVSFITSDANIAAIIADRFYPMELPQTPTLPAATYFQVSFPRNYSHSGRGMATPRYQIDLYDPNYDVCQALFRAIDNRLSQWNAMYGHPVFLLNAQDVNEPELSRYRKIIDVEIYGLE